MLDQLRATGFTVRTFQIFSKDKGSIGSGRRRKGILQNPGNVRADIKGGKADRCARAVKMMDNIKTMQDT